METLINSLITIYYYIINGLKIKQKKKDTTLNINTMQDIQVVIIHSLPQRDSYGFQVFISEYEWEK